MRQQLKYALLWLDCLLTAIALMPPLHDLLKGWNMDVIDFRLALNTMHILLILTCIHISKKMKLEYSE